MACERLVILRCLAASWSCSEAVGRRAQHMASPSGSGVLCGLLEEVSGSSRQLFASGLLPKSRLSCRFSKHTEPEKVVGAGEDLLHPRPQISPLRSPQPTRFCAHGHYACTHWTLNVWLCGCSSAQSTWAHFPLAHVLFPQKLRKPLCLRR